MDPLTLLQRAIASDPQGFGAMSQQEKADVVRGVFKHAMQQSGGSLSTGTPEARSYFQQAFQVIGQPTQGIRPGVGNDLAQGAATAADLTLSGAVADRATGQRISGGRSNTNLTDALVDIYNNAGVYFNPADPVNAQVIAGTAARQAGALPFAAADVALGGPVARGGAAALRYLVPSLGAGTAAAAGVVGGSALEGGAQGLLAPEGNLTGAAIGAGLGAAGGLLGARGAFREASAAGRSALAPVDVEVRTFLSHSTLDDVPTAMQNNGLSTEAKDVLMDMYLRATGRRPSAQVRTRPGEDAAQAEIGLRQEQAIAAERAGVQDMLNRYQGDLQIRARDRAGVQDVIDRYLKDLEARRTASPASPVFPPGGQMTREESLELAAELDRMERSQVSLPDIGDMPPWENNGFPVPAAPSPARPAAPPAQPRDGISLPDIGPMDPWDANGNVIPVSRNRANLQAILRDELEPQPRTEPPADAGTIPDKERLKLIRGVIKAAVAVPQRPARRVADVVSEELERISREVRMMDAQDAADGIPLPPRPTETPSWWKNLSVEERRALTHSAIKERELSQGNPRSFR